MKRIQLSKNFYLDEFTRSEIAARQGREIIVLEGSPVCQALRTLAESILQPLREALGPVHITSGYRPIWLNRQVKSGDLSQHVHGLAADLVVSGHTPLAACRWIEANAGYDQLIHEFGRWTHVSIAAAGPCRLEKLTAVRNETRVVYAPGLHEIDNLRRTV